MESLQTDRDPAAALGAAAPLAPPVASDPDSGDAAPRERHFPPPRSPLLDALKWLLPGVRVKRWLLVVALGILLGTAGIDLLFIMQLADLGDRLNEWVYLWTGKLLTETWIGLTVQALIGLPLATLGVLLILYGVRNTLVSVTTAVAPERTGSLVDTILKRRQLAQGYRIVAIGGGTGLSTLLRGLKEHTSNITAIVTVTDDGGSSGRLQKEFGMLPPGDIRNCLVALADAEPLMQRLFQYRFQAGGDALRGHSFGNLLIAAMLDITGGDFEKAVREASRVLAIRGRVLPSTLSHVRLAAELADGTIVEGETNISRATQPIERVFLSDPEAEPLDEAIEAIRTADAILIGPGSVYTSVIPNFLVRGIAEAVARSPALKIYICNVMTQPGETSGFSASDHVRAIEQQAQRRVFDYVLLNQEHPHEELLARYAEANSYFVHPDVDRIRQMGYRPVVGNFISQTHVVRHDPERLAAAIIRLLQMRARW